MLSLAMIVRDEQDGLGSVLTQASEFCDELVVVDTGSQDDTVSIAREHGATVHEIEWPDSFCKARNYALDQTHGEWVMHLDGHDFLPEATVEGLKRLPFARLDPYDAVQLPMSIVDEVGKPLLTYPRERITRRHLRWQYDAHTVISPSKPVYYPYPIHTAQRTGNKPKRALEVLEKAYAAGDRTPRTVFYLARERFWSRQYAEAIPAYLEWLAMSPVAWEKYSGLLDLAASYECTGDLVKATEMRFAAVGVAPSRADAWAALGIAASSRQQWADALMYYTAAAQATKPTSGFVVEVWYSDYPKQQAQRCRQMLEEQS